MTIRTALLEELDLGGPGYGLGIYDRIKKRKGRVGFFLGSSYRALRKMEHEGLLESYKGETIAARGGPRIYYRLTSAGRSAVLAVTGETCWWGPANASILPLVGCSECEPHTAG